MKNNRKIIYNHFDDQFVNFYLFLRNYITWVTYKKRLSDITSLSPI